MPSGMMKSRDLVAKAPCAEILPAMIGSAAELLHGQADGSGVSAPGGNIPVG